MAYKVYSKESFSYLPTPERLAYNDKLSMKAASKYFTSLGITFRKHGFDGSEGNIWEYPPVLRHRPDLSINDSGEFYLCELKGCGSSNVVRISVDKIESYKKWEKLEPIKMLIFKSDTNQCCYLDFTDFLRTLKGLKVVLHEKMGRIFEIPCSRFTWETLH